MAYLSYEDIKKIKENTKVFCLTSPSGNERFLFFKKKKDNVVCRQLLEDNKWVKVDLNTKEKFLQQASAGNIVRKEKGNEIFLELKCDLEYSLTITTLDKL